MNIKRSLLFGIGALAAASSLPVAGTISSAGAGTTARRFPNFVLRNHRGEPVRFYDDLIRGKRVAINMMYTVCTGICPANTANLRSVREMLGDEVGRSVFMYSLTLRPDQDSPRALAAYVNLYGIQPGWEFLTGKANEMEVLRRSLGFYNTNPVEDADIRQHTGMVLVGNEAKDRWCMVPSLGPAKQIARAINET